MNEITTIQSRHHSGCYRQNHARSRRVVALLLGILVLSAADLVLTVAYLRSSGMVEINPVAAWIIHTTNSPWALAAFKILSVGVCTALLFGLRRRVEGEVAAWIAIAILVAMSVHWRLYSDLYTSPDQMKLATGANNERWLMFD